MKYYPVYLDISGRPCVVVGGGEVAYRKARRLLDCGARVSVVSVKACPNLQDLEARGALTLIDQSYNQEHIASAFLVIGATDDRQVNEKIFLDARARNILVNIVDEPERCDFILPAIVERGDLSIAVSTAGKSPALAKRLRQELESLFGTEYETCLQIMGKIREHVLARGGTSDENRKVFEKLIDSDLLEHIREKDWEAVRRLIRETVPEAFEVTLP